VNYVTKMDDKDHLVSSSCAVRGISHIRKASCMFGWDWGPKLPDMGIWRDISIIYGNAGRISDMYIRTKSEENKYILNIELKNDIFSEDCSVYLRQGRLFTGQRFLFSFGRASVPTG